MLTLTTTEVAALTGLDEKSIRKDVEHAVLDAGTPPRFAESALVYFRARALFRFALDAGDRRQLYALVSDAVERHVSRVELGPGWLLDVEAITRDILDRIARFDAWKAKLVTSEHILGGEPVFPNTRLAVRQVGDLLARSAPLREVREDYPYLTDEDLEFAPLFLTAYPRVGRPRGQATPR
jgi:uncharacterized protein (DUF433 family)